MAKEIFGDSSDNLFVATGVNFPDALAGSIFAGSTSSPIILVRSNSIPAEVNTQYLSTLSSKKIVTLGGLGAVSQDVFVNLEQLLK
ncbi:MAG: cell wall-binding repeat-containing protein [Peptococcaceae bacterium]|nr:cell wall-binding repeat-containing protein [Peptococcaceae bacterium]